MKFHLPLGLLKVLLAVVCLPATTIAADAVPNAYTQPSFVYSGITVNRAAVDTSVAGDLYWNGREDAKWGSDDANWSTQPNGSGSEVFTSHSNVYFGADAANRDITVVQDPVVVMDFNLSGGDYSFSGGRIDTLGDATVNTGTEDTVTFNNLLVVQGNMTTSGQGTLELLGATTVVKDLTLGTDHINVGADLTVLGKFSVDAGSAIDAGSLTLSGNVTAQEMNIAVSAGEDVGNSYNDKLVNVSGNLSVGESGNITIAGTAEQHYLGVVTAGQLTVSTQEHDVYFDHLQVGSLTVGSGAHVHVAAATLPTSSFPEVYLSGTLALDAHGATYDRGYNVYLQDDAASLFFGSGSTIDNLNIIGKKDDSGYTNVDIEIQSRAATVTRMENLGDLKVELGSLAVKNATGAVHGELILDNGKLKLGEGANNLMAADSGALHLENGAHLDIGTTTQALSAGNEVFLSGAASITGDAAGLGLQLADGVKVNYEDAGNSIDAKMTVEKGLITLNSTDSASSLEISGHLIGSGALELTGSGTVAFSGTNTGYDGLVTVQQGSTLALQNTDALLNADVTLNAGSTLAVDTLGTANVKALTFQSGSSLAISSITGTDDASALHAVLNAEHSVTFGGEKVELNVIFSGDLKTLTTYNIMTGVSSIENLSFNVTHNGAALDASQYKIGLDADTGLLYMDTLMGNVWEGKGKNSYYAIWSLSNTDGHWSSGNGNYDEMAEYNDAIFGDLNGGNSTLYIQGKVSPGDVYFVADETDYWLNAMEDDKGAGYVATGTHIHKDGLADVTLKLFGNMSAATALGDVEIQSGRLILGEALAVSGTVTIDSDARLVITGGSSWGIPIELKMGPKADGSFNYTAKGIHCVPPDNNVYDATAIFSGVTMTAEGIFGSSAADSIVEKANLEFSGAGTISDLTLIDTTVSGKAHLSNVVLAATDKGESQQTGYYRLNGVTFGENVVVEAGGEYSLVGKLTFESSIVNKGVVYMTASTAEIGQLDYTISVVPGTDKAEYKYRFVESVDGGRYDTHSYTKFSKDKVYINGINLSSGFAKGVLADFIDNEDGSFTISIGNDYDYDGVSDGTVGMPQWDKRWGKTEEAPAFSRRYAEQGIAEGDNASYFVMAEAGDYYKYSSIVNKTNADKVNGGNAIVVTLSSAATGGTAVGGSWGRAAYDHEVWIYDRSGFRTVIAGQDGSDPAYQQTHDTHLLVNVTDSDDYPWNKGVKKALVVGGSRWFDHHAESFVTVQNGNIKWLVGGTYGGSWGTFTQTGTAHVFVDGGTIDEIFAAGYDSDLNVGTGKQAVELVLSGGTLGGQNQRVFGGGHGFTITGDIYIRMDGDAVVQSQLVGGSNGGTVNGDIVLDLISGTAQSVEAAGLGWEDQGNQTYSYTNGNVLVNLYRYFHLGTLVEGSDTDYKGGSLYGGKENGASYVKVGDGYTTTLHLADSGRYELGSIGAGGYTASEDSAIVTGFDRITLADGAHAVVALGKFDTDMDPDTTLSISGKGVVEVIGHGANFGRDILLTDGATLKVSTSVIGRTGAEDDRTITVTEGSSIDFSGFPVETQYQGDSDYAGLGFNVVICGNGTNGMGALYKGKYEGSLYPKDEDATSTIVNRIVLPNVMLTGSASVGVEGQEYLFMNADGMGPTQLDLAWHTFTKLGAGDFIARSVDMTAGTVLVEQGSFGSDLVGKAAETDMVLAAGTELKLDSTRLEASAGTTTGLELRSLSGSGTVILNGSTLTLNTGDDSTYYAEYMDEAQSHDQFSGTTGFGYAVFSGLISDGRDKGKIVKTGKGVHYISGSDNTYTGGTQLQKGRLYLLGSGEASEFSKGTSKVASGVAGTGAIIWSSAAAELYLGHEARIYNEGTANVQGGIMTIGVEGAPNGVLADYVGIHSKGSAPVVRGGVEYVEIETHNLKSIAVKALYADGTEYVAGTDIDRNKMLLVKMSDWDAVKNTAVTGFSDTGYNEAIYSGVLYDSNNVAAVLHKVGVGTLVLDQTNTYTGGTEIDAGTLRLRGWGTLGKNAKENSATVQAGATLMFTHNGGYGNEPTSAANDIIISGSGDARWLGQAATDGDTAALISAVGPASTLTLSGDITGTGNVRHSGEGKLVLSGNDSSYSGGTYVSRGTLEVQSAKGLGATSEGLGAVTVEMDADLLVTVEDSYTEQRMVTTLAADENDIQGDVVISGTADTERMLHMDGNGYKAHSTTLNQNGTLLLNGAAINGEAVKAESKLLTGSGKVVVSDASGAGASATFDSIIDYAGDFHVEGNNASIGVLAGAFSGGGSIHVSGKNASVNITGGISILDGESLNLSSAGNALSGGRLDSASVVTSGTVSIAAGAKLYVSNQDTVYDYDLAKLKEDGSLEVSHFALMQAESVLSTAETVLPDVVYKEVGTESVKYDGRYDFNIAVNSQAAGAVQAAGGVTLAGGSTYETVKANTSLMGGRLTLDTMENSLVTFFTTTDVPLDGITANTQLVLFSDVSGVYFGYDKVTADANTGIYYTRADRYITGCDYIDDSTLLVYDSYDSIVYLHMESIPEPATATLSLLALAGLAARRRRK